MRKYWTILILLAMSKKPLPFSKPIEISADDRGIFAPFISSTNNLTDSGLAIKRIYYVYDFGRGIIRGFHFHKKEWKYFTVVAGAAKVVAIKPKNPRQKYFFISSARKPDLIVIPPGFANGWVSLEDQTILLCASTASFEESVADDQRFDPYKWGDIWKVLAR